ncbi:hypothetical protein F4801DRAFT_565024 [Xylaria longipes]|nr:hypothetical protein F4801DRAFT_565024 [Xylaria longipes]RYC56191.1 hypothetical protein CHU98_g10017 [Xylaria longipes]
MRFTFMSMLLLSALSSAAPLSSSRMDYLHSEIINSTNRKLDALSPDAVDFGSVGDAYKRSIKSPEEVDFEAVGDAY